MCTGADNVRKAFVALGGIGRFVSRGDVGTADAAAAPSIFCLKPETVEE
jgi:hypothetical protein